MKALLLILFLFQRYGEILKTKSLKLGSLETFEITLLEYKPIFSLKVFHFYPGDAQDVFHTHSFHSVSLLLSGNYEERFFNPETKEEATLPRNRSRLIYIPKDQFHQITKSNGCWTLMITGPWSDYYREYYPGLNLTTTSTHGRRLVSS